jgi:SAM-dependent methyltransferase
MTDVMAVDVSNAEQARAWNGDEGAYWAANAGRFEQAVARYNPRFLDAARIGPGDRVLDVGCGTGDTTRAAARLADRAEALGVDLSATMIEVARQRAAAEGLSNVRFLQADAQIHEFAADWADAAISRTGAMFFGDPVAAFRNIARAVRPGGRLALLVWQALDRNEWIYAITAALSAGRAMPPPTPRAPGPFSMSDPGHVDGLLTAAGFADPRFDPLAEPICFGTSTDDAYRFIVGLFGWMLDRLGEADKARALDDLRATLAGHETPDGVWFNSAAWLISAVRA